MSKEFYGGYDKESQKVTSYPYHRIGWGNTKYMYSYTLTLSNTNLTEILTEC